MNKYDDFERSQEREVNPLEYLAVLWRRKWTVIAIVLVMFAYAAFTSYRTKPTYTARGTLLIEKEPNILTFEEIFQIETFKDDFYQTQYKLLRSRTLAEKAVERLKLYENAEFVGKPEKGKKPIDKTHPAVRRSLVSSFLGRLDVRPIQNTRLVDINFRAHDPDLAARAVNALFDSFIDMNIEAKYQATEQATEFLTAQIASLGEEIAKKEKEIQAYGAEKNIIALSDKETTIIENLGELNKALTEAQIDRVKKQAIYNEIKSASPDNIPAVMTSSLIQKLREDYVKLKREYMKKQEIFRPDYPELQRLKTELESAEKLLENETQNLVKSTYSDYTAALKKEKSLEQAFNKQKQEAFQFNSNAILYNSAKIEIENKKNLLESLLRRQNETGIAARLKGLKTSNVRVVDKAEVPLFPSGPNKQKNMILGFLVGLLAGIGLAFLFEWLDNSVKSSEDVERYAGLPTLGIVPTFTPDGFGKGYEYGYRKKRAKKKIESDEQQVYGKKQDDSSLDESVNVKRQNQKGEKEKDRVEASIELIPHISPKSNFSESYRSIRTALLLSSADPGSKAIAISSPLPLEGKTVTISNLAVTLAQANKRVLIVDSDFRKPRMHKIFKILNLNGLTSYLTENANMNNLVKKTFIPNLFLINSGPVPPNPSELLVSERMANLIKDLRQEFNYILFDTPPILAVSDAMALSPTIDGVILIVRGEKTSRDALKSAKEKLDLLKIKTLGVIINNIKIRKHDYYLRYKHHYYHYYEETENRL